MRTFPIQPSDVPGELLSIPWSVIAPHEEQAHINHSQTLLRLSERGGLSACEAVAVIENRRWQRMDKFKAALRLKELIK